MKGPHAVAWGLFFVVAGGIVFGMVPGSSLPYLPRFCPVSVDRYGGETESLIRRSFLYIAEDPEAVDGDIPSIHPVSVILPLMNKIAVIARPALALVLVAPLCGFIQDEWMLFSPDKKFSIELPGKPMLRPPPPDSLRLNDVGDSKSWALKIPGGAYGVFYIEDPAIGSNSAEKSFSEIRRKLMEMGNFDVTITSEKEIKVGGYPGMDFLANATHREMPIEFVFKARAVIARDRIYCAMGMMQTDADDTLSDRFFNSFKILKP